MADNTGNKAAKRRRTVRSVFPVDEDYTPSERYRDDGVSSDASPASGQTQGQKDLTEESAAQQKRYDTAWEVITAFISLPKSVPLGDSIPQPPSKEDMQDTLLQDALLDLLQPNIQLPLAKRTDNILVYFTQETRLHYVTHVRDQLAKIAACSDETACVLGSIQTLQAARRLYMHHFTMLTRLMDKAQGEAALRKFDRDVVGILGNSMSSGLISALRKVLGRLMQGFLGIHDPMETPAAQPGDTARATKELLQLVDSLGEVGLGGEQFEVLFAELLDSMMVQYVRLSFTGDWSSPEDVPMPDSSSGQGPIPLLRSRCMVQLLIWIGGPFKYLIAEVTARLGTGRSTWLDAPRWLTTAVGRLVTLRINELFDMVVNWPNSEGGINDLRFGLTSADRRWQLTDAFTTAMQRRLLHPGCSTLEIVRTYIYVIRTFHKLDDSHVMLDRVAHPLHLYLCTREDTVRIIVAGLLATPDEVNSPADSEVRKTKLVELVGLLNDASQYISEPHGDDWDDPTWMPAPIDAGANYTHRKSEDVIGKLISAVGSPDVFIKEFQSIIGERFLSGQASFLQEMAVLKFLKKRFGDNMLQACDVMIKDIYDSQCLDAEIHRRMAANDKRNPARHLHAKVLSRLYWPELGEENFRLPEEAVQMRSAYEVLQGQYKTGRKLKWLNHLGQATVELELEDRKIVEQVRTYEAAVIHAFGEENPSGWTFEELWVHMQMDEDLLAAALQFWEQKQVLRKADDRYVVIERLSDATAAPLAGRPTAADSALANARKAKSSMSEKEKEKRTVYWQFIVGMLTNSSPAMPLAQIAMMMKMLMPDGFPWSNEELQDFLAEKIEAGELEIFAGKYKLIVKR